MASSDAAPPDTSGTTATNPVNEKHNPTTAHQDHAHGHATSSPVPENAPVLGAFGYVGEPKEKAEEAATAFKHHPTEPPLHRDHEHSEDARSHRDEKDIHILEEGKEIKEGGDGHASTSNENTDGEDDDEVVYPGKYQLGLLTLGLCLATFTVALGESLLIYWNCGMSGGAIRRIQCHSLAFDIRPDILEVDFCWSDNLKKILF